VAALLDDLPAALPRMTVDPTDGTDPVEVARGAARIVAHLVPEAAGRASRVLDAVEAGVARTSVAHRLVHGDLYEAQVLVDGDFTLGLVDLDDLGPGDPAVDAANFTAHLVALALAAPAARGRLMAYRSLLRTAFAHRLRIDPADLDWREALAMLQLATGPFRVLHADWPAEVRRRVDLAVRLSGEGMR
jgi:aminoglycoside phosphotransferase (APT) family kinase protein